MYKITIGTPEQWTPTVFVKNLKKEPTIAQRFDPACLTWRITPRGLLLEFPLEENEQIYGLGLQLKSLNHKGTKKCLRPNADPISSSGDSHAPVPFFVSTKGYGIYVDSARYVTFYCGYSKNKNRSDPSNNTIITNTQDLYAKTALHETTIMAIEIPVAKGVDLYVFEGDSITQVVAAYNRFCGGGCLPPLWGLGVLYRCYAKFTQDEVLEMARYFRKNHLPCDILGLEPGWQSNSYSCSFTWDSQRFPQPEEMLQALSDMGYQVNLWEHAFVHSTSPLYAPLKEHSADYEVWRGLVPDFADRKAQEIFAAHHAETLVSSGVLGFKLDECDGSDHTGGWSFPDCSSFPSGLDGEQMHCLFGTLYQQVILIALGQRRTLSQVRCSGALAAPYPFVLYSDLYDHGDFIRGLVNSGFSGILWTPELRDAKTKEDLLRRMQTLVFSPQMLINAWYIPNVPWLDLEAKEEVAQLLDLRMSLVPYLYAAFYTYHTEGIAPVRALISDFTWDTDASEIDDEYLLGPSLLVAPITAGKNARTVYLPQGTWYDFYTGAVYQGGFHMITTENIPVYVRENTVLPLARPVEHITPQTVFDITLRCYGSQGSCCLIEDDGETYTHQRNFLTVNFDGTVSKKGDFPHSRYRMIGREVIQ